MKKYCLKRNDDIYFLARKKSSLQDGLQTTEAGNNVTITSYTGTNPDVVILNTEMSYFCLGRPSTDMKLNVAGYNYTLNDTIATLTSYNSDYPYVDTPEPILVDD